MFILSKKIYLTFTIATLLFSQSISALSNLTRNDFLPLYTTRQPHAYLHEQTKDILHEREPEDNDWLDKFSFYITPFGQNANCGRAFDNKEDDSENPLYDDLGSLNAKWSLVGLLTGALPKNKTLSTKLTFAQGTLFMGAEAQASTDAQIIDPDEELGFFSFPAEYKKRGLRFQLSVGIFEDLGFMMQAGVSDINFNVTAFSQETQTTLPCAQAIYTNYTAANVDTYLNCEFKNIASELELDLTDFHKSAVEDIRLSLFWRHAFEVNEEAEGWSHFLFIPYIEGGISLAAGKEKEPLKAFGLPFGNNGHNAIGGKIGINLDFTEAIEIGIEAGATHFFENTFNDYPTPTSTLQSGIFPFKTKVRIEPGFNWQFGMKLNAHHFLDKMSFYFQWVIMEHKYDKFRICDGDPAFIPEALEKRSGWKAQIINTALNYDVSPNVSLGFAWQAPISQKNVFRSTSVLFGLNLTF